MVANTANKPAPRAPQGQVLQAAPATAPAAPATAPAAPAATAAPATAPAQYIALLVPGNPKKPGSKSHARWEACHVHGQTVAAYQARVVQAGYPKGHAAADIAWERKHGFIALYPTAAQCPPRPVVAAPAPAAPAPAAPAPAAPAPVKA